MSLCGYTHRHGGVSISIYKNEYGNIYSYIKVIVSSTSWKKNKYKCIILANATFSWLEDYLMSKSKLGSCDF